jgi:hypothetical protein
MADRWLSQDDDFTVAYYEGGRFRLCLDTSDPGKLPRFRQAIDCIEAILKITKPEPALDDDREQDFANRMERDFELQQHLTDNPIGGK